MGPCEWEISPTCSDWDGYTPEVQESALELAKMWMWGATGRRFGACPVTVRPAQSRYGPEAVYAAFPVIPGSQGMALPGLPFLFNGRWFNSGCGTACCGTSCALELRGPVASIEQVLEDGEIVPASAYRVDVSAGAWLLVRTDGRCWPVCQNFTAETTEDDTFEVSYSIGTALPLALVIATGQLACEYGKQLTGGKCALPAKMTRLSRQGVEIEVAAPDPANGMTGIKMIDDVITTLNPGGLRQPPRVMSPDLPGGCDRQTVIPAGS